MTGTRRLSEFVAGLSWSDLPSSVVAQACRIVLDAVGCAVAAWSEDPAKARHAGDIARLYPAVPGARVVGAAGIAAQPAFAALANGMLVNATDHDDTHKHALVHFGSILVPTVLALAETRRLSGQEMILALVAGYEVGARIGMAVMPSHYRSWHSTATNGTFAAAAAAAKAFGLDADGVQRSLGLAGTQAAGLNTFFEAGDMTKSLHPGKASLNGLLSAQMAALGVTSPPDILEHPKGYLAVFSFDPRPERLTAGLGTEWEILRNGFKFFPSILAGHSPVQATLAIVARHRPDPRHIARIVNRTYTKVVTHFSSKQVGSPMAARVSVPYCIAAAAVDGQLTHAQFTSERITDPVLRQVLDRTDCVVDPELDPLYPGRFPARVMLTLESGESFSETVLLPRGDPEAPTDETELIEKFRDNCRRAMGAAQVERLRDTIMRLPEAVGPEALCELLTWESI